MSRTYRRRGQRHEYRWVLRDWKMLPFAAPVLIDRHSPEGRRRIARFHSDAEITMRSTATQQIGRGGRRPASTARIWTN